MSGYLRKTFEYTAGNTFNKIILLLLLPLFTRFMTPEEYAVYTNIMIFLSFIGLIYILGLQQALFSHFYELKTKEHQFTIIMTILITISIFGLIFSSLVYTFRSELSQLVTTDPVNQNIFIYISVILFCDALYTIVLRILNTMELSLNFALLSVVKNLALLILIFWGSLAGKFSLHTVFLYMLISSVLSLILALIHIGKILKDIRKKISGKLIVYSFPKIGDLLKFGLPMIPGTMALLILRVSDRYMLTYLSPAGLYDVGIYAIGYRIGMIITFLTAIVSLVYFPYAMRIADDPRSSRSYRKMFKAYAIWGSILGFLVILFAWEISILLIDVAYFEAVKIVAFGVISSFLHGMFNIINISFYIRKRAGNIAFAVGIGAIINIVLNFLLIPKFGMYGAGVASVLTYIFIFVLNLHISENLYPLNYDVKYVTIGLISMAAVSTLNFFYNVIPLFTVVKIFLFIVISIFCYNKFLLKKLQGKTVTEFIAGKFRI